MHVKCSYCWHFPSTILNPDSHTKHSPFIQSTQLLNLQPPSMFKW